MIWFNMIIPIIAIIVLVIFFKKKMAIWEYSLVFLIPFIGIFIAKYASIYSQSHATEYLDSYLVSAEYYEYWSTWKHRTCTRTNCVGSGKTRSCHTVSYDCSYCDENQPHWVAYDNMGKSYNITQEHFERLCRIWGKRQFVEMNRNINHHWNCGVDGNKYITSYDGVFDHTQPVCNKHSYENKVQCSKSIFNFQKVDKRDIINYNLVNYRKDFDRFNYDPVYGIIQPDATKRLNIWNSKLGTFKQVHMNIIIFKNQPIMAAELQKALWKGGNKNEFILCIGINDSKQIQWTKVISWTEQELLKLQVERTVANMEFNLTNIVDTMAFHVQKDFKRKEFKDFKYLNIEPTSTAIFVCFLVTMILTIGLAVFSVKNEIDLEE